MGQLVTRSGAEIDFRKRFELNDLFDRGGLKQSDGLQGELGYRDDSGREQKYNITARECRVQHATKIVYELVPGVNFSDTCVNIFRAMLTVLAFRIAKYMSPEHKDEVHQKFEDMLAQRQAETRFPMFDQTLKLLDEVGATRAEPGNVHPDPKRADLIFGRLTEIQKLAREFSACRHPEKSVDVCTRMERAGYREGLFGLEDGGYTQPFILKVKGDDNLTEKLADNRSMLLKDGQTMLQFDPRTYTAPKEVEPPKDVPTTAEERAAWLDAIAHEDRARDLAEKLYGGQWTFEQQRLFAAALDEMVFISQQFGQILGECPGTVRVQGDVSNSAVDLMRMYGTKLGIAPRFIVKKNEFSADELLDSGFMRHQALSKLGDDQMVRAFFAHQVTSDTRLTEGMTPDQLADVVRTFSTIPLTY